MAMSEQELQRYPKKADLGKRIIAAIIDGVLCIAVGWIPLVGWIASGVYMLVRDGLKLGFADHRSVGKKLMKLRPVRLDGQPMDITTSVRRNLVFVIGMVGALFGIIPFVGWFIAIILGILAVAVVLIELALIATDPEGRRLGDKLAGTKVVEVGD
ncbi:MAG TPA: RDD family protein [Blastocatellia bacterium]|nr:RDD family protein [Blastocatellia bacterium]